MMRTGIPSTQLPTLLTTDLPGTLLVFNSLENDTKEQKVYPFKYESEKAKKWLDCLQNGKPINPPDGGWTANDVLMLAGVAHHIAHSQGPVGRQSSSEVSTFEHKEAAEEYFDEELKASIEFHSIFSRQQAGDFQGSVKVEDEVLEVDPDTGSTRFVKYSKSLIADDVQ